MSRLKLILTLLFRPLSARETRRLVVEAFMIEHNAGLSKSKISTIAKATAITLADPTSESSGLLHKAIIEGIKETRDKVNLSKYDLKNMVYYE